MSEHPGLPLALGLRIATWPPQVEISGAPVPPAALPAEASGPPADADPFGDSLPTAPEELEAYLRRRIAAGLYLGRMAGGDRLPSIRDLARRTGLNHKVARRIYQALEGSGLVEIRNRSGIYVADSAAVELGLGPVEAWIAGVLLESQQLGLRARDLPLLLDRLVGGRRLLCLCADATEDDRFALGYEIAHGFGLTTLPEDPTSTGFARRARDADLIVTTPFHAEQVREAVGRERALVVASRHPALAHRIQAAPSGRPVRIVCVERAAGERLRDALPHDLARRVRVLALGASADEWAQNLPSEGFATLAAWTRLATQQERARLTVLPFLSLVTARQIARIVIRLALSEAPPLPTSLPLASP